jgi:maltooligosyltrehalose trehalohydrolase
MHGAVLGAQAFLLRWLGEAGDRLLIVNLGPELALHEAPEPLLAPPLDRRWQTMWTSESVAYGGGGSFELDGPEGWRLPAHAAVVLGPEVVSE